MQDRRMLKYPLFDVLVGAFNETVTVRTPRSLGINHIAMQNGVATLWSLVDLETDPIDRTFRIVGTGDKMEPVGNYLGTVHERVFVWHIFEIL